MIIVPVLALTLVAAGRIYTDRSTTYSTMGTELLVSGRGQASAAEQLEAAALGIELLEDLWRQPSLLRELVGAGLSDNFEATLSETATTLQLEVIAESPLQAVQTAERLVDLAPELLSESIGARRAESLTVEQAVAGTPDDALPLEDGTFEYTTVIVVGTTERSTLNPFPASLATVRSLVAIANSIPFQAAVAEKAPGATFRVTGDVREAPLLSISTGGPTAEATLTGHQAVVDALATELDLIQADARVEPQSRTQLQTLVPASYAVATPVSKVRPVAAVVVLGSGLAVALATLVEAIAADRRRRRGEDAPAPSEETAPEAGSDVEAPRPTPTAPEPDSSDGDATEQPAAPEVVSFGRRSRSRRT